METPEAAPRAPAPGTVPLPIGDVLRIADEYERGGRLDEAKRLLDYILAARRTRATRCICPASSRSARARSRQRST